MFIGLTHKTVVAPKERHVHPAVNYYKYIALRWSAISWGPAPYKDVAPPEERQVS
jgi:hypothetical protein